jgi:putative nucleotidyltransferase with HDIG domain
MLMESRHIVISGLAITALAAAIALGGWIPDGVIALLFLGAGLGLTYTGALIKRQRQKYSQLQAWVRALEDLHRAGTYEELTKHLAIALYRVLPGEETEVQVLSPAQISAGEEEMSVWADLLLQARTNPELVEKSDGSQDWFLLPIRAEGAASAEIIVCGKRKHDPQGLQAEDKEILRILRASAARVLTRLKRCQEQQRFMEQLLQIAVEAGEGESSGFKEHGRRVAIIADRLGRQLGLDEEEAKALHYAALLHDIGRSQPLQNADEEHPCKGAQVFPDGDEWKLIREAIKYHHERYDGSGFPEGRKMTDIPFLARIIAVADIFDGLTALAPEEERLSPQLACQVIQKATGSSFDPLVVVALTEIQLEN